MTNKYWSEEELKILENMWGRSSLNKIAKRLNRTENAVKIKARRMFGNKAEHKGLYTGADLARAIGVESKTINYYIKKGLKYRKVDRLNLIRIEDFWEFAKEHKTLIKFYKFSEIDIPNEPKWVDIVRKKQSMYNKANRCKKWTNYQDILLTNMVKKGMTTKQIAKEIQRTEEAVKARRQTLNLKYILKLENENRNVVS